MIQDHSEIVILVVENKAPVRMALVLELHCEGYAVLEAESGEDALIQLDDGQRVDILITDIQLSGDLTGWDVAEKFRAAWSDILVVYTSHNSVDHARKVSGSAFFNKPYRTADISKVCNVLGRAVWTNLRGTATGT